MSEWERGRDIGRAEAGRQAPHQQWSSNAPAASHFPSAPSVSTVCQSASVFLSPISSYLSLNALLAFYHSLCLSGLPSSFHSSPIPIFNLSLCNAPFLFFKPVIHSFLSLPSISLCLCSRIASLLKHGPRGFLAVGKIIQWEFRQKWDLGCNCAVCKSLYVSMKKVWLCRSILYMQKTACMFSFFRPPPLLAGSLKPVTASFTDLTSKETHYYSHYCFSTGKSWHKSWAALLSLSFGGQIDCISCGTICTSTPFSH